MKYLIIAFMLICSVAYACDYCIDHPGEKEMQNESRRLVPSPTKLLPSGYEESSLVMKREHLILLRRINELDKKIDKLLIERSKSK